VFYLLPVDSTGGTKHGGRCGKSDVVVLHLKVASTICGCEACWEASSQSAKTCVSQIRERFHPRTQLEPAGDLRTEKAIASGELVGGFRCGGGAMVGTSGKSISLVGFTRLADYIS
jgi:hypothetical protein